MVAATLRADIQYIKSICKQYLQFDIQILSCVIMVRFFLVRISCSPKSFKAINLWYPFKRNLGSLQSWT